MSITLFSLMQQRRDTAAAWTSLNPTLLNGELGYETDTGKWKVGTGSTAWSALGYTVWSQVSAYPLVNADIASAAEIAVSKLANGTARQLLQTDAGGSGVEFASNVDVPGTLDVTSAATFDNNVTIQGNLTVNGTTTTIDTTTLVVEDKNIEMGAVSSPSDVTANGGGITLKGTTDKTINWVDATDAWTLSEHLNIASAKEFRIAGTKVLDATGLGSAVVASSLTSVGTIATGVWNGTPIATAYIADDAISAAKIENTAVTAGAYTNSNITVDAQGRITAAASGTTSSADKITEGNTEAEVVDTGSDGHFKVTTEGVERLRVGPAGQVGIAGANYGTSGQVLTSAGSGGTIAWATPASGGVANNATSALSFGVGTDALDSETSGSKNTAFGVDALTATTSGASNTAMGYQALKTHSNGGSNSAFGDQALFTLSNGSYNTAVGCNAMYANSNGGYNVAVGYYTLDSLTSSNYNTAVGVEALEKATTSSYNTCIGYRAGNNITTGQYNLIAGGNSIGASVTTGSGNVLLCSNIGNTSGSYNTYVGYNAGYSTSGSNNVIVGAGPNYPGYSVNGSSNVIIGDYAGYSVNGNNCIIIGQNAAGTGANNEITLGHTSIATIRCNTQTISSLSDGRDKTEVTELPEGLEFINSLNPVKFKWQTRDGNGKDGTYEAGFIAQDLQSAQSTSDADYLGLVMDENPERLEASYGKLVPMLVKAIQQLKSEVDQLKANV